MSCDDKTKVSGEPLAFATRNWKVWVPFEHEFEVEDHDMCINVHACPSVNVDVDFPDDNKLSDFFKGKRMLFKFLSLVNLT